MIANMNMNNEPRFEVVEMKNKTKMKTEKKEERKRNENIIHGLKLPLGPVIPHPVTPVWAAVGPTRPPLRADWWVHPSTRSPRRAIPGSLAPRRSSVCHVGPTGQTAQPNPSSSWRLTGGPAPAGSSYSPNQPARPAEAQQIQPWSPENPPVAPLSSGSGLS